MLLACRPNFAEIALTTKKKLRRALIVPSTLLINTMVQVIHWEADNISASQASSCTFCSWMFIIVFRLVQPRWKDIYNSNFTKREVSLWIWLIWLRMTWSCVDLRTLWCHNRHEYLEKLKVSRRICSLWLVMEVYTWKHFKEMLSIEILSAV